MIRRDLEPRLRALARKFPVVTLTGPRQSGKTTLCRAVFPDHPYVSLEAPDTRAYASDDPRGFLADYRDGAIFDEVQRAPELLSYIQTEVDARPARGRFILTGSTQFALLHGVSQSLAGRTAILHLLPLGLGELKRFPIAVEDPWEALWQGSYPAIFDRRIKPSDWYPSYVATYVERDVRALLNIGNVAAFQTFLGLCAGRVGQLVNLSALGADAGITHATAKAWLSVLEAGYVAWRLQPYHANIGKRLVKTPKLHFFDSGLVCYMLGIRSARQLREHPLRGAIFETWVASEVYKARVHRGLSPQLSFYRDRKGVEVDLLVELGDSVMAIEAKSGRTIAADSFDGLDRFTSAYPRTSDVRRIVVHGGDQSQRRAAGSALPWSAMDRQSWWAPDE